MASVQENRVSTGRAFGRGRAILTVAALVIGVGSVQGFQGPLPPQHTDDYVGTYAVDEANTEAGGIAQDFSHYLNPALRGVAPLNLTGTGDGIGVQSHGETLVDLLPLVHWDQVSPGFADPVAPYDSDWSTKTWDVPGAGTTHVYKRRRVTLPSGASLFVFRPETAPASPCGDHDRDAMFVMHGYQGGYLELSKTPVAYPKNPDAPYMDPYDGSPFFGYEVETPTHPYDFPSFAADETVWIRMNSFEYEAMQHGMTLVYVMPSVGARPFYRHLAQIIEAAFWLDGTDYEQTAVSHRKFIMGGSYDGFITLIASLHMPWLFRGAISSAGGPDARQTVAVQELLDILHQQLRGDYAGEPDLNQGFMQMYWNELETGLGQTDPAGNPQGMAGPPVDLAGLSLLAHDLAPDNWNFDRVKMPLFIINGDEDAAFFSFFDTDLESHATGFPNAKVIEKRVPLGAHGDNQAVVNWNRREQIVSQLLAEAAVVGCPGLSSPADIDWVDHTDGNEPHRSTAFRETVLKPATLTESQPDPTLTVNRVQSPDWAALEVLEGLGAGGKVIFRDVDGDGAVEVIGGTSRGDLVKVRLQTVFDAGVGGDVVQGLDVVWRTPAFEHVGRTELLYDAATGHALAVHQHGPLVEVCLKDDLAGGCTDGQVTVLLDNDALTDPLLEDDYRLGKWLGSLEQADGDRFTLVNEKGEVLILQRGAPWTVTKGHVEGGARHLTPISGGAEAVYSSPHGNLKRISLAGVPSHPTSTVDMSVNLFGQFVVLDSYDAVGNSAMPQHVGFLTGKYRLLRPDLGYLGWTDDPLVKSPVALILPDASPSVPLRVVAAGVSGDTHVVEEFNLAPNFGGQHVTYPPQEVIYQSTGSVTLPDRIVSLTALASGSPTIHGQDASGAFAVAWLATLTSGQVALIGDLGTSPSFEVFGELLGGAYGFARDGDDLFVLGRKGKVWRIDPFNPDPAATSSDPPLANLFNMTVPLGDLGDPPYRGAVLVNNTGGKELYGLPDGGATYGSGVLIAMPYTDRLVDDDVNKAAGGVQVVEIDKLEAGLPEYFYSSLAKYDLPPGTFAWQSSNVVSSLAVGGVVKNQMLPGVYPSAGHGNSAAWADLDGDGDEDLVMGTRGGRLLWWQNGTPTGGEPDLPSSFRPTGELTVNIGDPTLGWAGDLGSRIIGLTAADLDGDGDDELIVGLEMDLNDSHPEHHVITGSLYVVELSGGGLQVVDRLPLGFGIYGVHHTDLPGGTAHDIVASTATGQLFLVSFDPVSRTLSKRYQSGFIAPYLGAYNSIESFPDGLGGVRLVLGSAGGLFAFDVQAQP